MTERIWNRDMAALREKKRGKEVSLFVRPLGLGRVNETLQRKRNLEKDDLCAAPAARASSAAQAGWPAIDGHPRTTARPCGVENRVVQV